MQIRSSGLKIHNAPIGLDPTFPIGGGAVFIQTDRPITYLHIHECVELGYCHSGSGVFLIGKKVLPYETGDVTCIPPGEVHLASSTPGTESRWSWIYCDLVRLAERVRDESARFDPVSLIGSAFPNVLRSRDHPDIARVILRMIGELQTRQSGRKAALRALGWELLILLRRIAPSGASAAPPPDDERLVPALNRMSCDYALSLPIGDLARLCGLSEPHFRRLFKATIGRSPCAYRNDLRLQMASSLLRGTTRSVLEISQDVGFETLSSFNRLFKARFARTPRSWRRNPGHIP